MIIVDLEKIKNLLQSEILPNDLAEIIDGTLIDYSCTKLRYADTEGTADTKEASRRIYYLSVLRDVLNQTHIYKK